MMTELLAETPEVEETVIETVEQEPSTPEAAEQTETTEAEIKKPELTETDKAKLAMQKRIDKLTAQKYEKDRLIEELRAGQSKQAVTTDKTGMPKEEDFQSIEDYLKAVGKWEAKQEFETQQQEEKRKQSEAAYQADIEKKRAAFNEKEAEFKKDVPDYDEAVGLLNEELADIDPKNQGFQVFRDIMLASDNMPALSYHLGKNPELLESLKKMPVLQMAKTLFIEEYKLSQKPKPKPSTKPEPPRPLGGSSKGSKDLKDMSSDELLAWMKKK